MRLKDVFDGVSFTTDECWKDIEDFQIKDIAYNSNRCKEGYIFVAIRGETVDGHDYVRQAYENGARIFVVNRDILLPEDAIKIFVEDSRKTLSRISANFFDHPSKELSIVGITGTKGKTTISNYLKSVLENAGFNAGVIGTNGIFYNGVEEITYNTTPESYELQKTLRNMLDNGVQYVSMEVSSSGLMMNRVADIDFDLGIFSNISHDHIGPREHPTFEHYLKSKAKLFKLAKYGIVNMDDKFAHEVIDEAECPIDTFSILEDSDFQARDIRLSDSIDYLGSDFICKTRTGDFKCSICSPGVFSVYNALAVIAACKYLEIDEQVILDTLKCVKVNGRVEVLPVLDYASVILDYAHNGVSLQNILGTLKEYNPNRLICLIGSIGKRAKLRRKELGDIAAQNCDICVLTSDNPDSENPMDIIDEMAESFTNSNCQVIKEPDREKAINIAIQMAEKGDIILLAGKGHEEYQLINGKRIKFSDRDAALEAAKRIVVHRKLEGVKLKNYKDIV
ncbi:MAG: UDP-N-acetylmuramoyl-L-alanyl-D-glutamate--2,6-diaminopimelate ligase [Tissierellaceae bacterium]